MLIDYSRCPLGWVLASSHLLFPLTKLFSFSLISINGTDIRHLRSRNPLRLLPLLHPLESIHQCVVLMISPGGISNLFFFFFSAPLQLSLSTPSLFLVCSTGRVLWSVSGFPFSHSSSPFSVQKLQWSVKRPYQSCSCLDYNDPRLEYHLD